VATRRTNTLPAILCQRAQTQIQTRSKSPGAKLRTMQGFCEPRKMGAHHADSTAKDTGHVRATVFQARVASSKQVSQLATVHLLGPFSHHWWELHFSDGWGWKEELPARRTHYSSQSQTKKNSSLLWTVQQKNRAKRGFFFGTVSRSIQWCTLNLRLAQNSDQEGWLITMNGISQLLK